MASRIEDNVHFAGTVTFAAITLPDSTVTNAKVAAGAGIEQTKLQHQHRAALAQSGTATAETRAVYRCYGATGTLLSVRAGSVAAAVGDSTVTVDVKKNGTTVLSAAIVLDNGNAAYASEDGTLSVTTLAAGDVLTVVVTVSAGTGTLPTGLFVEIRVAEDAA